MSLPPAAFGYGPPIPLLAPATMPTLTARQLRLSLLSIGITPAAVDTAISQIVDPQARAAAQIEWEYSSTYERNHPLVATLGATLGLTPAQVDAAWQQAAAIP